MGATGISHEAQRVCLLVVEPDFQVREILISTFEDDAVEVIAVQGDREARVVLQSRSVDIVLAEIVLRDGDGEALADFAESRGCRVALISGHPDGIRQGEASARPFLAKPFGIRALREMVLVELTGSTDRR